MQFPFISPLKSWTVEKLKSRERNPQETNLLSPFIFLSSAAVVTTGDDAPKLIQSGQYGSTAYYGCVVANTTDYLKMYQTGETLAGYDLNGKPIPVVGEKNRRVSLPIITKLEIDTDGGNNALKTANLDIKVFTLKQLEMFELFFLRPSMSVVLEYGFNTDIRNKFKKATIESKLFAKKNHTDYLTKYKEIFSHRENSYIKAKGDYLKTLEETEGEYDYMAGKVTNFTFSPDADGTYNINLEVSAGNELQLWMPLKQSKDTGKSKKQSTEKTQTPFQSWVNKLSADLNTTKLADKSTGLGNEEKWKKEFFNWGVLNEKQKDTAYSKDAYISFRLVLEILNRVKAFTIDKSQIGFGYYLNQSRTEPIIPVNSAGKIISTTEEFILPGDLPKIVVSKDKNKKDIIKIDTQNGTYNCPINGYRFNLSTDTKAKEISIYDSEGKEIKIPSTTGNLLNAFVRYDSFVRAFNQAYTQADVINSVLSTINDNMFGLCNLQLQKENDVPSNAPLIIMDAKLSTLYPSEPVEDIYRFKIGPTVSGSAGDTIGSIVQEFTFNMELSNLMQAQALYSTQLAINSALKDGKKDEKSTVAEKDPYASADLSYAKNADGYYSINAIEIELVKEANEWNATVSSSLNQTKQPNPPEQTADTEKEDMNEVLKQNYVRFKLQPTDKNPDVNHLIYKDPALIQNQIPKTQQNTTALTYLDISLGIDGIAGLSCGEYFLIDGVPEIYNRNGYFQITNVKQGIDENGWKTTIEAGYRIKS